MAKNIRYLAFITAAAAVLLSPVLLGWTDGRFALSGVESAKAFPEITAQRLLEGSAQTEFEEYVQQNLPGKPLMVRLRNQITFALGSVPNNNYSMNRERNLFTWGNVSYYLQYDPPVTEDEAEALVDKLEQVRDLLAEQGMQLYIFITPCKVRYTEDEVPWVDRVMAPPAREGSYERLAKKLAASDLEYFDSIAYIDSHRQEFDGRVPLFYRTSVHWSVYVGNTVGAALGDFLEEKSGYNLPEVQVEARPCGEPVYPDSDAFDTFNLLQKSYDQYYESVVQVTDPATDAPGLLCRGGSFMGQSLSKIIDSGYFGRDVYMENSQIFTDDFSGHAVFHSYDEVDMSEYFRDIDIVVLEVNEPSISSMSFGFVDYILEHPEIVRRGE